MLKLYYAPQTRAVRPRWLLEEAGAPYELVRIDLAAGEQRKPAYLKINPNGTVPTLVDTDADLTLFESAAICQYLADSFPDKRLAPPPGTPARGLYYQWIHYAMSGLEPPAVTIFLHTAMKPEAERLPALVAEARGQLAAVLDVLETALGGRNHVLGEAFSVADVLIGSTLVWIQRMGLIGERPALQAYLGRLGTRPALQRALADERPAGIRRAGTERARWRPASAAGDRHAPDLERRGADGGAHPQVVADHLDVAEHLEQVAGDGDLVHRMGELAVLDPDADRAA
jgi:glutathione S-transferase